MSFVAPTLVQHFRANTAMLNSKSTVINIGPTLGQHCIPDANEPVFMLACPLLDQRWANVSYPTPTLNQQTNQNPTLGQRSHAVWEYIKIIPLICYIPDPD